MNTWQSLRRITSRENAVVREFKSLSLDARERDRAGKTIIEGEHLCRAWLDASHPVARVLVSEDALGHPETLSCIEGLQSLGASIFVVALGLMKSISVSDSAARIICEIPILQGGDDISCFDDSVLLDGVQDPGNVGAILRTAAAAGIRLVVAGPGTARLWSPKVLRAAMGAHAVLQLIECNSLSRWIVEATERASQRGSDWVCMGTSPQASQDVYGTSLLRPIAWVFGSEGAGISGGIEAVTQEQVLIPQDAGVESLNVAASVAVCLFEMRRQRLALGAAHRAVAATTQV
jgi:TrmH family RNA methyltransferase